LARKLPVIVIEEPHGAADDRDDVRRAGDLTVIRPLRTRAGASRCLTRKRWQRRAGSPARDAAARGCTRR